MSQDIIQYLMDIGEWIDVRLEAYRIHCEIMEITENVIRIGERMGIDTSETIMAFQKMAIKKEKLFKQIKK